MTIELADTSDHPTLPGADGTRADLRTALAAGDKLSAGVIDRLILPLVDAAVPDWQTALNVVLARAGASV